jgi:cytoskeletal protein CcmA (bactofilin family)
VQGYRREDGRLAVVLTWRVDRTFSCIPGKRSVSLALRGTSKAQGIQTEIMSSALHRSDTGDAVMWKNKLEGEKSTTADAGSGVPENGHQHAIPEPDRGEDVIAFVGKGVEFKGIITYDGTVRIDGLMDGEIHTEGILLVGEDAVITAKVSAGTIISKGKITGDIMAREKVKLLSPAVVNGSVKAPMLSMEEGVLFNGSCEMARAEVHELSREPVMRSVGSPLSNIKRVSG